MRTSLLSWESAHQKPQGTWSQIYFWSKFWFLDDFLRKLSWEIQSLRRQSWHLLQVDVCFKVCWMLISGYVRKVICSVAMDVFARMQVLHFFIIFVFVSLDIWKLASIMTAVRQQSLCCTPRMHLSLFSFRVDMVLADFKYSLGHSHLVMHNRFRGAFSPYFFLTWRKHLLLWKLQSGKVLRTPTLAAASEVRVL